MLLYIVIILWFHDVEVAARIASVTHLRVVAVPEVGDQMCIRDSVDTVGDLVKLNRNDLLKFRNFGKKSLTELDDLLANLNLHFGMDVTPYKLDKD